MSLQLYRNSRPGLGDGARVADRAARVSDPRPPDTDDLPVLVAAAILGDEIAWTTLVRRFDGRLRGVARSFRLPAEDVDDVIQAAWVQALRALPTLRDARVLGAWLTTMVRRESLRSLQRQTDEVPTADCDGGAAEPTDLQESAIAAAARAALRQAIAELPERQRALLSVLAADECPDYQAVAARLGMPVGSIGPIRARGLERLRRDRALRSFAPAAD